MTTPVRVGRLAPWAGAVVLIVGGVAAVAFGGREAVAHLPEMPPEPAEATGEQVRQLCAACHVYPPPETFPKTAWRKEVVQGFDFYHADPAFRGPVPHLEAVVRYYTNRAPDELAAAPRPAPGGACPATFTPSAAGGADRAPGLAHVAVVTLRGRPEVLACDALNKQVLLIDPNAAEPAATVLAAGLCCGHAEVCDLNGDGIADVVLAVLGSFYASDERTGRVVWLKGKPDGTYDAVMLLDGLGRVADVRPADFNGDGKLDLVVAEFGWHRAGSILVLENSSTDEAAPTFTKRVLDTRHGTTHVPVADLNGDGKPDVVAVISQEHETAVAFLNDGRGGFRTEPLFTAPHPTYGCNGAAVADLDGDGDADVILTNGDSLDAPYLLRPDHGVTWLENRGTFPFTPHRLADVYGCGGPAVADFDGDGRLDVAVGSFLPAEFFPQRAAQDLDSVVLLCQTAKGKFDRHALERRMCDHLTCAAGDVSGDGRPDLIAGRFVRGGGPGAAMTVWRNTAATK